MCVCVYAHTYIYVKCVNDNLLRSSGKGLYCAHPAVNRLETKAAYIPVLQVRQVIIVPGSSCIPIMLPVSCCTPSFLVRCP